MNTFFSSKCITAQSSRTITTNKPIIHSIINSLQITLNRRFKVIWRDNEFYNYFFPQDKSELDGLLGKNPNGYITHH